MTQDELIEQAVQRLNRKNLGDLWLTHAVLSLVEYFGTDDSGFNALSPLLNLKVVSLFGDAILRSSASDESPELLTATDAAYVLNCLLKAEDAGAIDESVEGPEKRVLHWIGVMASSQLRFQSGDIGPRIARSFALTEVLPNAFRDQLEHKHGSHFIHLPGVFVEHFGLSLHEYFQSVFRLYMFYKSRHDDLGISERIWEMLSGVKRDSEEGLRLLNQCFAALVDQSKAIYRLLVTTPKQLLLQNDPLREEAMEAFFNLIASDTATLRRRLSEPAAQIGYYGHRISPLEMAPVVNLAPESQECVVPDYRKLDVATTQVPHYALMKVFPGNEYNELLGSLQELYIEDLTSARLEGVTLIAERVYGKEHKHGPDLTIVDHSHAGLICIESKAKRVRAEVKVNPVSDLLLDNLTAGIDALEKLPKKIEELYTGRVEYADVQPDIDLTRTKPPICVIVLGEGVFSLPHVVHTLLDERSDHFLHDFPYPYCFMSLDVYERAVEVTAANSVPFYETLYSYWQSSIDKRPKEYAAEEFGGLRVDYENWYLGRYMDMLLSPS